MSSPDEDSGRGSAIRETIGKESISSKFRAVNFNTPESGDVSFETPDYDVSFATPDLAAIGRVLHNNYNATPNTVAPKITRIQRERERTIKLAQQSSGLLESGSSRTTGGDTTIGDIILYLNENAEDMNSSMIRKSSNGRVLRPTDDDDIFTAPPAQGKSLDWMHRRARNSSPNTTHSKAEDGTPTKDPGKKGPSTKDPLKRNPSKKGPPKKKLGIPFPNFGRFWCAKYNWEEVQGAFVVKMFEQCDPEDKERVKELYELAWVIKVSTAMVQCDIQDQARVQQLVRWAQDFRSENDWQCPTPLGWNLKQQQYVGPRPSDEERQRFVDYAWQMNQNKDTQTLDNEGKRRYDKAALEVFTFKKNYPEFPHDYPPGYPGEHPNYKSESTRPGHHSEFPGDKGKKFGVIQKPRGMKRKATAIEGPGDAVQELKKKIKTSVKKTPEKGAAPKRKRTAANVTPGSPSRSDRHKKKRFIV